jgi:hypothetical protein
LIVVSKSIMATTTTMPMETSSGRVAAKMLTTLRLSKIKLNKLAKRSKLSRRRLKSKRTMPKHSKTTSTRI